MSQDYIALEWVKGEIQDTLQQAQQSLEAYGENPQDKSRLKFCFSYLHQVHGTLQMVEFYGAALLAEEMEAVASALADGTLTNERDGLSVLMQAIIQLPHYLDHIKVGNRDLPVVLLPILNELRSARGENLLSETALFSPRMVRRAVLTPAQLKRYSQPDFLQWIRKVRQMFQAASAQLLQNKQPDVAMEYLLKVFGRLNNALGHTPNGVVWLPAMAFTEWLQAQASVPASAKLLLRELDAMQKELIQDGARVLNHAASDDLVKNLLFYIARTAVEGEAIKQAQKLYHLADSLPTDDEIQKERDALSGPDRDTIGQVLSALAEEIATIKDRLDLAMRDGNSGSDTLNQVAPAMKQVSDTMGMLGLGSPRRTVQEQLAVIESMQDSGHADQSRLFDVAGALLFVEATLAGMIREGNLEASGETSALTDAQKAVLREARNVLEQVKDAIIAYVGNQWNVDELRDVPGLLYTIAGSLRMLPLADVAEALTAGAPFVEGLIDSGERCDWATLDAFADVLSGVEYFIERYAGNPDDPGDQIMDRVWESLQALTGATRPVENGDADAESPAVAEPATVAPEVAETVEAEVVEAEIVETEAERESDVEIEAEAETDAVSETADSEQPAEQVTEQQSDQAADDSFTVDSLAAADIVVDDPASEETDAVSDEEQTVEAVEPVSEANNVAETPVAEIAVDEAATEEAVTDESATEEETAADETATEEAVTEAVADDATEEQLSASSQSAARQQVPAGPVTVADLKAAVDNDLIDDDIIEIFLEEAAEVTQTLDEWWPIYRHKTSDAEALSTVRRAFHTLKGSGRMVQALIIGELAWSVENLFNRIIDKTVHTSPQLFELVEHVIACLPTLINDFREQQEPSIDTQPLMDYAFALAAGAELPSLADVLAEPDTSSEESLVLESEVVEIEASEADVSEIETSETDVLESEVVETEVAEAEVGEPESGEPESAEMVDPETADPETAHTGTLDSFESGVELEEESNDSLTLESDPAVVAEDDAFDVVDLDAADASIASQAEEAAFEEDDDDSALLEVFTQEANNHLDTVEGFIAESRDQLFDNEVSDQAQRALHTLKGSAHMAGISGIAGLAGPMERLLKEMRAYSFRNSAELIYLLDSGCQLIRSGLDSIDVLGSDPVEGTDAFLSRLTTFETDLMASLGAEQETGARTVDPQAISSFLASGMDSLLDADQLLMQWQQSGDLSVLDALCSDLSEVADGAEKADQGTITELALTLHSFYQQVSRVPESQRAENLKAWSTLALDGQEELLNMMDCLAAGQALQSPAIQNDIQALTDSLQTADAELLGETVESDDVVEAADTVESEPELVDGLELSETLEPEITLDIELDGPTGLEDSDGFDMSIDLDSALELDASETEEPVLEQSLTLDEELVLDDSLTLGEELVLEEELELDEASLASDEAVLDADDELTLSMDSSVDSSLDGFGVEEDADNAESGLDGLALDDMVLESDDALESLLEGTDDPLQVEPVIDALEDAPTDALTAELDSGFELETDISVPDVLEGDVFASEELSEEVSLESDLPLDSDLSLDLDTEDNAGIVLESGGSDLTAEGSDSGAEGSDSGAEGSENDTLNEAVSSLSPMEYAAPPMMDLAEDGQDEVVEIFLEECEELLESIDEALDEWRADPDNLVSVARLQRDLHTVKGGARMAELGDVADVCHELETIYERVNNGRLGIRDGMFDLLQRAHDKLHAQVDDIKAGIPLTAATGLLMDLRGYLQGEVVIDPDADQDDDTADYAAPMSSETSLDQADSAATADYDEPPLMADAPASITPVAMDESDREILEIFIDESSELHEGLDQAIHDWEQDPSNMAAAEEAQRVLHTLKGGARLAGLLDIGDQAHEFESRIVRVQQGYLNADADFFRQAHLTQDELVQKIDDIAAVMESGAPIILGEDRIETASDDFVQPTLDMPAPETDQDSLDDGVSAAGSEPEYAEPVDTEAFDSEDVASDESAELTTDAGVAVDDVELDTLSTHELPADTHDDGEFAFESESGVEFVNEEQTSEIEPDSGFAVESIGVTTDSEAFEAVEADESADSQTEQPSNVVQLHPSVPAVVEPEEPETSDESQLTTTPKLSGTPLVDVATAAQQVAARRAPQELVKVSADLLDDLVNLAGETSIGRGRLEQQVSDFSYSLEEMENTLDRLRDQLRRLDMETEAQVLFRQERQGPDYEDFDPLEMDRYSTIQQLSRALVESASDLLDLKETLADKTRDAETLLLQQSRVNTELQEGLMKTRMVQFQRLVPRLRRIVRQVSQELGKQVDFRVLNADGELDRTILERMISPLEHMVRNAVDHGIETIEERRAAGKPDVGQVQLDVSREGGDVVLTLRDDGKGVNRDAVRAKAIERGLMTADAKVSDHDLLQFILQAGFSTAKSVTQISGRGVGLDVVSTEIKQIGGSVEIHSEEGQGTQFVVRLPFTVSVNRALMVRVGDDLFAVPLNNIRGIVRASAKELQGYYQLPSGERFYEYGSEKYALEYLGVMLENESQPKVVNQNLPLPVLLVNGPVPYALQVDTLLGSREIVVKTLGPQFASVMGVSGGTILGDGNVVIILDLPALIRTQASLEYQQARLLDNQLAEQRIEQEKRPPRILVVDDSVTVRKVTTRLLERNGMEVLTAQDGVDAMAMLQDHMPDLMLLDIEMPRMDGFELASIIRHDSRLKHIPIIMITSRTGDKHRERALSIGVNEYMGKPFQEEGLLGTMQGLLDGVAQ